MDEEIKNQTENQEIPITNSVVEETVVETPVNDVDVIKHIKGVIEAILFVNEKPVTLDQFKKILSTVSLGEIKKIIRVLMSEYDERESGMAIVEIAGGYQMLSNRNYVGYLREFYKTKHKEKLSKPALETIAIIAYKQPVTRADIEVIRGVNSDGVVSHLLEKDLLKIVGRKDIPGRPHLYGTTKQFLEYFGLKSLQDLPKLEEFPTLQPPSVDQELPTLLLEEEEQSTENVSAAVQSETQIKESSSEIHAVNQQE